MQQWQGDKTRLIFAARQTELSTLGIALSKQLLSG
jgi:hypothetical protein